MNKNLIVTGGIGFIGSNLIGLLLKKKYKVIVVSSTKANYACFFSLNP